MAAQPELLSAKDKIGRSAYALALLAGHRPVAEYLQQSGYQSDLHQAALALDWERYNTLIGTEDAHTADRVNAGHPVGGCAMWAAAAGGAGSDIWRVYAYGGDPNCTAGAANGQKLMAESPQIIPSPTATTPASLVF